MEIKGSYTGMVTVDFSIDSEVIREYMETSCSDIDRAIENLSWSGKLHCSVSKHNMDKAVFNNDTIQYRLVGGTKEEIEEFRDFIDSQDY